MPLDKDLTNSRLYLFGKSLEMETKKDEAAQEFFGLGTINDKISHWSKLSALDKIDEKLQLGELESDIMKETDAYFKHLQVQQIQMLLQLWRTADESQWLKTETARLTTNLKKLKDTLRNTESEKLKYIFLNRVREGEHKFKDKSDQVKECELEVDAELEAVLPVKWRSLYPIVLQYIQQGRYELVSSLLSRQASVGQGSKNSIEVGLMNYLQGLSQVHQNRDAAAITLFKEALLSMESATSATNQALACILEDLGKCYIKTRNFVKAEEMLLRSVAVRSMLDEPNLLKISVCNVSLAEAMIAQNKHSKCVELLHSVHSVLRKHLTLYDTALIRCKIFLAEVKLETSGDITTALRLAKTLFDETFKKQDKEPFYKSIDAMNGVSSAQLKEMYLPVDSSEELLCIELLAKIFKAENKNEEYSILTKLISLAKE